MTATITISRFARDGFTSRANSFSAPTGHPLNAVAGVWVFVRGAEAAFSLPSRKCHPGCPVWVAEIDAGAPVYNWLGCPTFPREVLALALEKARDRGYVCLDHEDAGFFVPEESLRHLRPQPRLLAWAVEVLPIQVFDPRDLREVMQLLPLCQKLREEGFVPVWHGGRILVNPSPQDFRVEGLLVPGAMVGSRLSAGFLERLGVQVVTPTTLLPRN
ncbi:MAG: hypothetical protein AB1816_00455 [Bacillota bacterium]